MKRFKFLTLLAAVALTLLPSCSKDPGSDTPQPGPGPGPGPEPEPTVEYTITKTDSIKNLDTFIESIGGAEYADIIKLFCSWADEELTAFTFTYPSNGPLGSSVTLSAMLYVPTCALNGGKELNGLAIVNHGTITADRQRPTNEDDAELIAAWKGYAVVIHDYVGFGADVAHPQSYLDPDVAAKGAFDAFFAAKHILKDKKATYGNKIYNFGYSQGGFNSLANVKYLSEHPEFGLKFTKTFAGGGPFDVRKVWTSYLSGKYPAAASYSPLFVISANECEKLGIPYNKIFKPRILAGYKEWFLSKKYDRGEILDSVKTNDIKEIFTAETIDSTSEINKTLITICDKYSLTKGWVPPAGSEIYILHSEQDDQVPYACFESMKAFLDKVATDSRIYYDNGEYGSHTDAIIKWVIWMVLNWDVENGTMVKSKSLEELRQESIQS